MHTETEHMEVEPTLTGLLVEQAVRYPGGDAAVSEDASISYRQLLEEARSIAAGLRGLGVDRSECVGLFVESSLDLMLGTWGILFSGAAYLPLAPEYPDERLRHMIGDSRLSVVITQQHLKAALKELVLPGIAIVCLEELSTGAATDALVEVDGSDVAYVIYTSGTSGKPKGVAITHSAIASQMQWLRDCQQVGRGNVVLRKTPMSFDAAQWELLAVAIGSKVVMGTPGVHRDPQALIDQILRFGVTTLQVVPTLLQALIEQPDIGSCSSLAQVFSGGEALTRRLAMRCMEVLPGRRLINLYGPTECTINASSLTIAASSVAGLPNVVPIGQPVAGTSFHVLDEQGRMVADGQAGELYIGGIQLAQGYLHQPDLTDAKFVNIVAGNGAKSMRMYRTGDHVRRGDDGHYHFIGRLDNQVKIRGFRIELDEVRLAIENHDWVKSGAVLVKEDARTGAKSLVACVELNPREAALMDQGNHGTHHQSKHGRVQVRAQLGNLGLRDLSGERKARLFDLVCAEASADQRRQVFSRKTYRFYDGGKVSRNDVLGLLSRRLPDASSSRDLDGMDAGAVGAILRIFGQFQSDERLLPKYGYASPGALYATQLYLEIDGIPGLQPGIHYYHPATHQLALISPAVATARARICLHFIGKKAAIESVYRNNVVEVLEMEAGHMLGLFDETLPGHGLGVGAGSWNPAVLDRLHLDDGHHYCGSFELTSSAQRVDYGPLDVYLQVHGDQVTDLAHGQYRYLDGDLQRFSDEIVLKKHVIAINQQVYERASFGMTAISRNPHEWARYIDLGRRLQSYQMDGQGLGFMPSGYSSRTGNDLLAAKRMSAILAEGGQPDGPSYFFVGGRISRQQAESEGMQEDAVHMRGPAELIKKDIGGFLPDYMVPARIVVLDQLPLTANGKVDVKALASFEQVTGAFEMQEMVAPGTHTEKRLAEVWMKVLEWESVSIRDDFFERGGDSLMAVMLVHEINASLGLNLQLQVIFEYTTIEALARSIDTLCPDDGAGSRLVPLQAQGEGRPIYCWPGLGGYPLNLRPLAARLGHDRPFHGIQASGLNPGEEIYATIERVAAEDVAMIRRHQPRGPYTLWGYSFGARIAHEVAYQLERAGEQVDQLLLIAPGSPMLPDAIARHGLLGASYGNPAYLTILFSVFSGTISGAELQRCLQSVHNEEQFAAFVQQLHPTLDLGLVKRIMGLVQVSYASSYRFTELIERKVSAPITLFKAQGDDYSFVEANLAAVAEPPVMVDLAENHYGLLREPGVDGLVRAIQRNLSGEFLPHTHANGIQHTLEGDVMPHVNIKHFPVTINVEAQHRLIATLIEALQAAFGCTEEAISIAMEPIAKDAWAELVYRPEILERAHLLRKHPNY